MALTWEILGDGQLGAAEADLYLVPASTSALVAFVSFVYVGAGTGLTINCFVKKSGGTSRRIIQKDQSLSTVFETPAKPRPLATGDAIRGYASVANEVDYVVWGVKRT